MAPNNKGGIMKEVIIGLTKISIGAITANADMPFIGTLINECIDTRSRIVQNRINGFINTLSTQAEIQDVDQIDENYLKSEEFFDLRNQVLLVASNTSVEQKRIALAKIYIDAIKEKTSSDKDIHTLF